MKMKNLFKLVITVTVLITVIIFAELSAYAVSFDNSVQYQTENMVALWNKKDYDGESQIIGIGEYPFVDFKVRSITVPQEYVVYAYSEENFGGEEYFLNNSVDKLFSINIHNGITYYKNFKSFKVGLIESEAVDITELDDEKKNQIMITALAIMIAVAGYLNFAGETITEEEFNSFFE